MLENTRRSFSPAGIDYKHDFDSIAHSWILKSLHNFKISLVTSNSLKHNMPMWNTNFQLYHYKGVLTTTGINISCSNFPSDSLSPLISCMVLISLTSGLSTTEYVYKIGDRKINDLSYMDGLRLQQIQNGA